MRLRILGTPELADGKSFVKIGGPRECIVLSVLALRANRITAVEHLIDVLWGDYPPSTARGQIQGCISSLRKLFGEVGRPDAISTRASGYILNTQSDELDSEQFHGLVAAARLDAAAGRTTEAAAKLHTALALWRGPALDGIRNELVRGRAVLLDDARLSAIDERVNLDLKLGRHEDLVGELRMLSVEHPLSERWYGYLALALYRCGRQTEALEVCRRARRALVTELGIEPGRDLRDLECAMLNRDSCLELSPEKSAPEPPGHHTGPRQLPGTVADFIGREELIAEITGRLADERDDTAAGFAVPMIVISGSGGVGKSTLALRVAHKLADVYPDGHIYADLYGPHGSITTSELLARFLRALGVRGSGIPDDVDERAELYRSMLAGKRILLVLDDVTSEQQIRALLPGTSTCAVIVTSRARLCTPHGAYSFVVGTFDRATSLDLLNRIVGDDRLRAEPESTQELITYCGGLPLALRIAGARLASRPHWQVAQLVRRLRDERRRLDEFNHQGLALRSSIGLTYQGLSLSSRRLFRLLSLVQATDFPDWTAAALLDVDLVDAEEVLESLVDAQMLETVSGPDNRVRYRFHDLIRVFAKERALEEEQEKVRRAAVARVLGGWLRLAEWSHRAEFGGDYMILHGDANRWQAAEWTGCGATDGVLTSIEFDRAGLVAAVRQAATEGLVALCWDLALSCAHVFEVKGYFDEWKETAQLALNVAGRANDSIGRAAMLYSLGTLQLIQTRLALARESLTEAGEIFGAVANMRGQALVLGTAALVDWLRGDLDAMRAGYDDGLAKARSVGDLVCEATILCSMAKFAIAEGETRRAAGLLDESLVLHDRARYRRGRARLLSNFAELYLRNGEVQRATRTLEEVLGTFREIGDRTSEAHTLCVQGLVHRHEGRLDCAETTLTRAVSLAEDVGSRMTAGQACHALAELAMTRGDDLVAARLLRQAETAFGDMGSVLWQAKVLLLLARVKKNAGDTVEAAISVDCAVDLLTGIESREASALLEQLRETGFSLDGWNSAAAI